MLNAFFNENFTSISLEDIEMEKELVNQGYGGILLSTLIDIAKKRNINRISGWISNVDGDHWDRLEHFYKNHNFEVIRYEDRENNRKIGDIVWNNAPMS
jgi:GNAT superfamily N-acetyltransferase